MSEKKKVRTSRYKVYFSDGIWQLRLDQYPKWQRGVIKLLRIIMLAVQDYSRKQLSLRATALTLYSLLAIVPVIAMIFGIAQGFGLEDYLTDQLKVAFSTQPTILENLLEYVHNLLGTTKGGIIAGFGFALLLWAVIQVLSNIEDAFNFIWYVQTPRTWTRKFSDYLSIMLFAPLFIVVSGALNIFITTQLSSLIQQIDFLGSFITGLIVFGIKFLPYMSTIVLFFLLYLVLPNTRVTTRSAWYAGIVTGIVFQLFQWGYIEFQYGVSNYNAIYGSFASIPLFITWLQFSWMIVLLGAEISYSVQNIREFEAEVQNSNISHKTRVLYCIHLMRIISERFHQAQKPLQIHEISDELEVPVNLCKSLLLILQKCGLVAQTQHVTNKETGYIPAVDLTYLNIGFIIERIESMGADKVVIKPNETYDRIVQRYKGMEDDMLASKSNLHILEI
ncbi:MAG: YihY/virulence factor BrkB family protein [Bacteroidia bacterium]|jgi:membrane protein